MGSGPTTSTAGRVGRDAPAARVAAAHHHRADGRQRLARLALVVLTAVGLAQLGALGFGRATGAAVVVAARPRRADAAAAAQASAAHAARAGSAGAAGAAIAVQPEHVRRPAASTEHVVQERASQSHVSPPASWQVKARPPAQNGAAVAGSHGSPAAGRLATARPHPKSSKTARSGKRMFQDGNGALARRRISGVQARPDSATGRARKGGPPRENRWWESLGGLPAERANARLGLKPGHPPEHPEKKWGRQLSLLDP